MFVWYKLYSFIYSISYNMYLLYRKYKSIENWLYFETLIHHLYLHTMPNIDSFCDWIPIVVCDCSDVTLILIRTPIINFTFGYCFNATYAYKIKGVTQLKSWMTNKPDFMLYTLILNKIIRLIELSLNILFISQNNWKIQA